MSKKGTTVTVNESSVWVLYNMKETRGPAIQCVATTREGAAELMSYCLADDRAHGREHDYKIEETTLQGPRLD